jgi:hypothetical protein
MEKIPEILRSLPSVEQNKSRNSKPLIEQKKGPSPEPNEEPMISEYGISLMGEGMSSDHHSPVPIETDPKANSPTKA